jgi:hypothetical protein
LHKPKHLLDVNVLIALTEPDHVHHKPVMKWFDTSDLDWGLCAFSEAGFLRVSTNPTIHAHSVEESTLVLANLANHSGFRYWPITTGWAELAAPFRGRVFGHQQITDAYLLGLAVKEDGVLVTLDRAIKYIAGPEYGDHLLVLES